LVAVGERVKKVQLRVQSQERVRKYKGTEYQETESGKYKGTESGESQEVQGYRVSGDRVRKV
jgi:hypothetical protein